MKVLWVTGDDDYAALTFEDDLDLANDEDLLRIWNEAWGKEDKTVLVGDDDEIECTAFEFGPVDPKFIEFLTDHDMPDYDQAKHSTFYVVGE